MPALFSGVGAAAPGIPVDHERDVFGEDLYTGAAAQRFGTSLVTRVRS